MAYRLKTVRYKEFDRRILLQNENGPCPLLAAANALLLQGTITLPPHCLRNGMATLEDVTNLLANQAMASPTSTTRKTIAGKDDLDNDPHNPSHYFHIDELLQHIPRFQYGMDVNPKFTSITAYEYTAQLTAFDLLGVKLVHGWLVDPHDDSDAAAAIGTLSYNALVEQVIQGNEAATELERLQQQNQTIVDPSKQQQLSQLATRAVVIDHFLQSTSHQLTQYGLQALYQDLRDDELTVFFRNNHFGTLTKQKGMLYLLVTDFGYADAPDIVWEKLDVINGDTEYVNATFQPSAAAAAAAQQAAMAAASQQENADYQLAMQLSMQNQPNQTQQQSSSVPLPQQQQQSATASSSQLSPHYLSQQQHIAVGVPLAAPPKAPPQSAPSAASSAKPSPPSSSSSPGYVLNSTLQPIPPPPPRPKLPPQPESARLKPPPPGSLKEPPQSSNMAVVTAAVNKLSPTMVQLPPPCHVTTSTAAAANPRGYAMTSPSMTMATTGQSSLSSINSPTQPNIVSSNPNKPKSLEEADRLLAIQLQSFSDGGTGRGAGLAGNSSAANNPYEDESLVLARQLQDQEDEFARIRRLNQQRQQQQQPRPGGQSAVARPAAAATVTGAGTGGAGAGGRGGTEAARAGGDGSAGQGCQIS